MIVNDSPNLIALNNARLFEPSELFDLLGDISIDWDKAYGLSKIVPKSGNTKPYEPDPATYPLVAEVPAVPLEPEINWYSSWT